jgi:KpsF/GutQ family protein
MLKSIIEVILNNEIQTLEKLKNIDINIIQNIIDKIHSSNGTVIILGLGKSGYIANILSASLASIGISSIFLNPSAALHGELGMIKSRDIIMTLSNSGESKEITQIIKYCKSINAYTIAVTTNPFSSIAAISNIAMILPQTHELSELSLPTLSVTMMLVWGHILIVELMKAKNLSKQQYLEYHPGGVIGLEKQLYQYINEIYYMEDNITPLCALNLMILNNARYAMYDNILINMQTLQPFLDSKLTLKDLNLNGLKYLYGTIEDLTTSEIEYIIYNKKLIVKSKLLQSV